MQFLDSLLQNTFLPTPTLVFEQVYVNARKPLYISDISV